MVPLSFPILRSHAKIPVSTSDVSTPSSLAYVPPKNEMKNICLQFCEESNDNYCVFDKDF